MCGGVRGGGAGGVRGVELQMIRRQIVKLVHRHKAKCESTSIVGTLNQEEALVGAFSVIVKTSPMVGLQL